MSIEPAQITKERYGKSFEKYLGVDFLKYADGQCEISLKVEDHHLNIGGSVHGGIINALCDIALSGAVTCNFINKAETVVTMQMNVNFLRPGFSGETIFAFAEVIKKGRTIYYVEGGIRNEKTNYSQEQAATGLLKAPNKNESS